ncbi:MAG: hypothetical protein ACOX58_13020 [Christensenellales bacterium]|jgi:hypothetical protein
MFGRRSDGKLVRGLDPIVALTPYLMPMRCDAQVMLDYRVDYERLARYIVKKGREGVKITFTDLLIASYVRMISQVPELNRFIANKRTYARTELTCSFVVLQNTRDGSVAENTTKCKFDPHDTIYDVSARVSKAIEESRKEDADNSTMKIARMLTNPYLATFIAAVARLLDRYGLLPRFIIDASPFHTGLFIANMASIGMPAVRHHIYNFGTTSQFVSIGNVIRTTELSSEGKPYLKRWLPLGVVADERIVAGMVYSQMVTEMIRYLSNPELLEEPPETVYWDEGNTYSEPKVPLKKRRRALRGVLKRKRKEVA